MKTEEKRNLEIKLCAPRGFCAGVDRAIQIVEKALEKYGAPVYVRHEIVHNRFVVDSLKAKGAVFVEELDDIPPTDAPVIFSAHGVPKKIPQEAISRNIHYIDATCPLVSKVHKEAQILYKRNHHIFLIGHEGHPEVIGTMGQLPKGAITLVETPEDVHNLPNKDYENPAYITQTTLSVDDAANMISTLQDKFPDIRAPHKEDICYATTNRQNAVKAVAPFVDLMIVIGAPNSSNSQRLREAAQRAGCRKAILLQRAQLFDMSLLENVKTIGITAGASAPEILVEELLELFSASYTINIENITHIEEDVFFPLPKELREESYLQIHE